MRLVIFSNFFPYKRAEPFLTKEFEFSKRYFQNISLFTLYGKPNEIQFHPDSETHCLPPVLERAGDKRRLFVKGFFNLQSFRFHVLELFSRVRSFRQLYWLLVSTLLSRAIMASQAYRELKRGLAGDEFHVLYFYWGDNLCWILPYLSRYYKRDKVKVVIRLHGSDLYEELKADYAPLRLRVFELADQIVCISENGFQYLSQAYPQFKHKLIISRLGVTDEGLNPHSAGKVLNVISVSNMVALKRVGLIFDVLQQANRNIAWYHFGDGPDMEHLRKKAADAREGLTVHLMGHQNHSELMNFYKTHSMDVFINLSTTEGLPVSVMEALSFGIPVIATDVGGVSEIVSDDNGYLISAKTKTDEISNIFNHFEYSPKRREQARNMFLQKVSAETNYQKFYTRLIQSGDGRF